MGPNYRKLVCHMAPGQISLPEHSSWSSVDWWLKRCAELPVQRLNVTHNVFFFSFRRARHNYTDNYQLEWRARTQLACEALGQDVLDVCDTHRSQKGWKRRGTDACDSDASYKDGPIRSRRVFMQRRAPALFSIKHLCSPPPQKNISRWLRRNAFIFNEKL